ncbi:MAG: hypothetical protein NTW95_04755 [Candidatus Aminicenantes bacterium]|nr:hypothetical protein [Candidatus Aminicenantes bacterium]
MKLGIKKNLDRWFAGRRPKAAVPDEALKVPAERTPPPAAAPDAAAVEPEIAAVIAAVLAVEVKVFMALQGHGFTFNEDGQPQGWSEWGRLLVRPYQGVR